MRDTNTRRLILLYACFLYTGGISFATTYYVSPTGSNSNTGTSWAQAWLTLQYAADEVVAGDSVWIANGNYVGFDLRTTGTSSQPIVFIAAGNAVVIDERNPVTTDGINIENADYIELNGMRVIDQPRNGIRLVFADFCIVRNTYCDNNFERGIFTGFTDDILLEYNECLNSIDEHGIYVSNSSDRSIIRYNVCHHNNRGGIQINADGSQGGDGVSTDPQIYGNILYENGNAGGAAINLDGVQGAFIYNNILYENHATGIALFQQDGSEPSFDATIVHNTIVNASDGRWCILIVNGATGAQVFNNIIINQHPWRGSIAVDQDATSGFDSDYNVLVNSLSNQGDGVSLTLAQWQAQGYDEHSLLADPLSDIFENPGSGNYHLLSDAQAVDAGSAIWAFGVDEDIEDNARPQGPEHDMGAYEFPQALAIDEDEEVEKPKYTPTNFIFTNDIIRWTNQAPGQLQLFNGEGKFVLENPISDDGEIDIAHLPSGLYIVVYHDAMGLRWSRAIVRH